MPAHAVTIRLRKAVHRSPLAQIGAILALWLAGEVVVRAVGLPIPGGIVGMAAALALLASGRISLFSLRRGAQWFLAEMLLFFVPAVLAVTDHRELLGLLGLKILLIILTGTVTVMGVTAVTVDLCYRWRLRRDPADPVL